MQNLALEVRSKTTLLQGVALVNITVQNGTSDANVDAKVDANDTFAEQKATLLRCSIK